MDERIANLPALADVAADVAFYIVQAAGDYRATKDDVIREEIVNDPVDNRALGAADAAVYLVIDTSDPATRTLPANSTEPLPIGFAVAGVQMGAGAVTIDGEPGVTIIQLDGYDTTDGEGADFTARKISPDVWVLVGKLI